ncbi:proline--tRNA ligase, partial [candidate division WOR-3 bacterium]|nr:proline--tRNA ligase [candidate division WOR-3 bacterium]
TKFRDEIRPRGGLFRLRQFIMKDSYSFDTNDEMFRKSYDLHREAYNNIFKRCGLDFITVKASSGLMGGSLSEEFMVFSESGEDVVIVCDKCGYKANREVAVSHNNGLNFPDESLAKIYTPVEGSVEEISKFLEVPKKRLMKSLLYMIDEQPVFLLLDGEHELSDEKLGKLGTARAATPDEIKTIAGASPGYIGPVGLKTKVKKFADTFLKSQSGLITGANEDMYHLKGVNLERDLKIDEYVDLRLVNDGDECENCGAPLKVKRTIEIGHIFNLGTKYSSSMGAFFLNKNGERRPIVMGSYGTSPERIMMSIIETHHDEDGIIWPLEIAPYKVLIIPLNIENPEVKDTAETIWSDLNEKTETLMDDRNESVGVKFKDASLIGIPLQIIVGERSLKTGKVEIKSRDGKLSKVVKKENASKEVMKIVNRES